MKYLFIAVIFAWTFCVAVNGQTSKLPAVKKAVAPNYPIAWLEIKASGAVTIAVKVNSEGKVTESIFLKGNKFFSVICRKAAEKWLFESSSDPVRELELSFIFTLLPFNASTDEESTTFNNPYEIEVKRKDLNIKIKP